MKKLITLVGIISAIVFINPAQAKADVKAYVYFNPLAWLFTPPVRVVNRPVYRYRAPVRKEVVYVQPKRYKRIHRSHYRPTKFDRHNHYKPKKLSRNNHYRAKKIVKYNYNKRNYNKRKSSKGNRWN